MDFKLKILVVDDSVTYRQVLTEIISDIKDVELIGTASNGKRAIDKIRLKPPDLVLLDISMPEMDGLEALALIKKEFSDIEVIMVSGVTRENANVTLEALEAGALDFISKPKTTSMDESIVELTSTLLPIITLVKTRKSARLIREITPAKTSIEKIKPKKIPPSPIIKQPFEPDLSEINNRKKKFPGRQIPVDNKKRPIGKIDVVALGVSTGGPNALQKIIPQLNSNFPVPIIAVQHMPPLFTASLAERLDSMASIKVIEGKGGMCVENGIIYFAPGGQHMVVRKATNSGETIGLVDSPLVNSCRPSVDVLFRSIGMVYGGNVLTVILSGMGYDGASGVASIRRKGGYSIVQDEESSVVWGMPGAVVEGNNADEIVPLDKIARRMMEIVGIIK